MQPKNSRWKFVADRRKPVYPTLGAELDAIRRRKKAISFFATDRAGLDEDLDRIRAAALVRGLCVTIAPRGTAKQLHAIDLFVHRADGVGRIAPLQELLSHSPWSWEDEAKLGELLGYSRTQRAAWLAAERHARPAFGVLTLYGSMVDGYGVARWWWTEPGRVPAPNAYAKRPRRLQLWRVGVDPRYAKKLDHKGQAILATSARRERAFHDVVRTPYERLGSNGWQRVNPPAR